MAYVVNPDGTITPIETTHDQYGNLKPKITNTDPIGKSFSSSSGYGIVSRHDGAHRKHKSSKKNRSFFTNAKEIDDFFQKRKESGRIIYYIEFSNLLELTPNSLRPYLKQQYVEYKDTFLSERPKSVRERVKDLVRFKATQQKKLKEKQKNKNEFYQAQNKQRHYDYSSYDANDDHDGAYNGWE